MKTIILCVIFLVMPLQALALTGVVSKTDVCGIDHVIFKTSSGWYVTARYLSGVFMKEGDTVSGRLKTCGIQIISNVKGEKGKYYIVDFKTNWGDAVNAHCGSGFPR